MEKMVNCNYTTACIRSEWICDGNDDCWDNSDEENCDTDSKDNGLVPNQNICPRESTFQCDNGKCISLTWLCDLEEDCEGKFTHYKQGYNNRCNLCNRPSCSCNFCEITKISDFGIFERFFIDSLNLSMNLNCFLVQHNGN